MVHQLSFDYLISYDPGKDGISLPVKLQLDDLIAEFDAKLDTGASYSVFQRKQGEILGLDVENGLKLRIATLTGSFIAYGHMVTVSILDYKFGAIVYFAADENFPRNVLGRHGFLDQFRIGIVDYDGQLYISGYN